MNALTRWDPFRELEDMQNRLSSFLDRRQRNVTDGKESITVAQWIPLVDVGEDDNGYFLKAELPEIQKDQIKITVENGVLVISGERRFEEEQKGQKFHRIERAYGSFARSFTLPDNADPNKVSAEFKEGLLSVRIAKNEAARPKQIEVNIA